MDILCEGSVVSNSVLQNWHGITLCSFMHCWARSPQSSSIKYFFSHLGLWDEWKLINSLQKCTMPKFILATGLITDMMTITAIFFFPPALVGHRFYQASWCVQPIRTYAWTNQDIKGCRPLFCMTCLITWFTWCPPGVGAAPVSAPRVDAGSSVVHVIPLCTSKWRRNSMYTLTQFDWLFSWYGNNSPGPCMRCNLPLLSSLLRPHPDDRFSHFLQPSYEIQDGYYLALLMEILSLDRKAEIHHSHMRLLSWAIMSSFTGCADYIPYIGGGCNVSFLGCVEISLQSCSLGINTYTVADLNKVSFVHLALTFNYTPWAVNPGKCTLLGKRLCVYKSALLCAGESLGAGVIDRTMASEDWTGRELDTQSSSVRAGERSEGLTLFLLIAPSLTHTANEHIQSMAGPSRTSGTAFTTRVKSKVPSAQSEFNPRTPHASARCVDVNDPSAEVASARVHLQYLCAFE